MNLNTALLSRNNFVHSTVDDDDDDVDDDDDDDEDDDVELNVLGCRGDINY